MDMIRWRLVVVSCFLLAAPSTQTSPLNVADDSSLALLSQEWPLEVMLEVTAKKELREFVMNFHLDEVMCSSKALYELVVGEDSTDLAGYQWWSRQCGSKTDFSLLGFPDFTHASRARERRDANMGGGKQFFGLTPKEWKKIGKLITKMCCKPIKTMVELPTGGDLNVQLKPSCVAVRRCSGCCDSPLFECRPTKVTEKKFKVIAMGSEVPSRKIWVDEHKACECSCRLQVSLRHEELLERQGMGRETMRLRVQKGEEVPGGQALRRELLQMSDLTSNSIDLPRKVGAGGVGEGKDEIAFKVLSWLQVRCGRTMNMLLPRKL
ncbi:Vascular endothelial growth factor A [Penaeus vannamei]|uniref:Vascular endothelial growth factor A n=1 Tax=Penaeus vannamei TaxID=6689 RepID=A0A423TKU4_PENVA|nr:Vascular endothelial growth factor A [Penaeus vannamei]